MNLCRTRSLVYLWWLKFSPKSSEVKQRQRAQEMNNQNASGATEAGWIAAEKLLCNILQLLPSASICQHLPASAASCHLCTSYLLFRSAMFFKQLCASQCPAVGALVHAPAALPSSSAFLASWRLLLRDPLRKACQKQHTANKH